MATQTATATFTGAEDSVAVTWTAMPGNFGISAGVQITDGSGPVAVSLSSVSSTGATVNTSARFTGTVSLMVWDK